MSREITERHDTSKTFCVEAEIGFPSKYARILSRWKLYLEETKFLEDREASLARSAFTERARVSLRAAGAIFLHVTRFDFWRKCCRRATTRKKTHLESETPGRSGKLKLGWETEGINGEVTGRGSCFQVKSWGAGETEPVSVAATGALITGNYDGGFESFEAYLERERFNVGWKCKAEGTSFSCTSSVLQNVQRF